MAYRRCGDSGLLMPALSLGLWQNFGANDPAHRSREIVLGAFDSGITCFDLANNYGPPPGSAEETFGNILRTDLAAHRDEMVITTKAGHPMWDGPYGDWASRKSLIASCDQSLKRLGVDYVDIFYSHRHDPATPLEETMQALDFIVRSGRALYAGISKYPPQAARRAAEILRQLGTPCLVHQVRYSLLNRTDEYELFLANRETGMGCVSFSPLAQGLLSDRYLHGIPEGSRAARHSFLTPDDVGRHIAKVRTLNDIAASRGQTLAQMAIAWQLYDNRIASVIVGVSSAAQLDENLKVLENTSFTEEELKKIDAVVLSPEYVQRGL